MEVSLKNANNFCRACLKQIRLTNDECLHIFDTPELAVKLSACISAQMCQNDEYSQYLCTCCCQKVNDFFLFQEMCYASLRRFEELQQFQQACNFEDEVPISVEDEQTIYPITVAEANFIADHYEEIEFPTKNPAIRKSAKEKDTRNINFKRTIPSKSRIREHSAHDVKIEIALLSDGNNLDCFSHNSSFDEDTDALHTVVTTTCNIKNEKGSSHVEPISKAAADETKKKNSVYHCDICPSRFIVEHRLIAHKRQHEGLIPYPCPREGCDKSFRRWHSLSKHLNQHEGQKKSSEYVCDQEGCGKVYKRKPTLILHQRNCHNLRRELKTQICEICGKALKSISKLNDHRYTHKDKSERPFACDQPNCTRRFSTKQKLKIHLMRHAGIKNYECPHCGMRKTTKNELNAHINYHTLKRTWACLFCTKVCNNAGNLRTHVRTVHERAKDYACRYCELSFAKPDTRKYHEMRHTGEKPNVCAECGRRFTQPGSLRTHMKIHQKRPKRNKTSKKCESNKMIVDQIEGNVSDDMMVDQTEPAKFETKIEIDNNTQDLQGQAYEISCY